MNTLDDHGFEIFEQNPFPIAYLLTFRTYGTWLHGDSRLSVGRSRNNNYGEPKIQASSPLNEDMATRLAHQPVIFGPMQRNIVSAAITEVCTHRSYELHALNVRSNHVHAVVSRHVMPEKIVNDFKAYSTRNLRRAGGMEGNEEVWSRGGKHSIFVETQAR